MELKDGMKCKNGRGQVITIEKNDNPKAPFRYLFDDHRGVVYLDENGKALGGIDESYSILKTFQNNIDVVDLMMSERFEYQAGDVVRTGFGEVVTLKQSNSDAEKLFYTVPHSCYTEVTKKGKHYEGYQNYYDVTELIHRPTKEDVKPIDKLTHLEKMIDKMLNDAKNHVKRVETLAKMVDELKKEL